MAATQQTIDFHRGGQLYLLDRAAAILPEGPSDGRGRRRLRRHTAATVLRAIDTLLFDRRGREDANELSRSDIGRIAGASPATVKHAIALLESAGILAVDRAPGVPSTMAICWTDFQRLEEATRRLPNRPNPVSRTHHPVSSDPGVGEQRPGSRCAATRDPVSSDPGVGEQRPGFGGSDVLLKPETKNPPPPPSEPGGGGDWEEARKAVADAGIHRDAAAVELARSSGWSPQELIDAATIVRHTAALGPGAIFDRLRSGAWPAADVPTIDEIHRRIARRAKAQTSDAVASAVRRIERDAIHAGRRSGHSDAEIQRQIDAELSRIGLPPRLSQWSRPKTSAAMEAAAPTA